MNIMRVKAMARKEFIQIWRDPRSLALAIAIPMLLLVLFGFALTLDVDNVPLAVWDQDQSARSADLIRNFSLSRYFKIVRYCQSYREMEDMVDRGDAMMLLVIPADFSGNIMAGRAAPLQLIADGSDSNTATIALAYGQAIIQRYNQAAAANAMAKAGVRPGAALEVRARVWFNPDLKSRNFIIPGLIAVIIMIIAALLTSLTVAREWERGTMEQLIAAPVTTGELILGKFLPYFAIGLFDMLVAVGMAQFVYGIPLRGSFVLLVAMSALFLTGALGLGMLISIVTRNQLLASQMAILTTFLPTFLLSGFAYAIPNMPGSIQVITRFVPARYFIVILKGIYLKGVGLGALGAEAGFLLVFTALVIIASLRKFKRRVA
jgi:ABC-2 type transport system permease protein